ncbi:hypothetical protein ACFQY0_02050 [Haloferula chungangensis]|uniref:Verru_Chthon cassette protein A n=1 Tax=Haloferula chungangensis TaxID=1048331 RepID=A0ABW2L479_9BACT
MMVLLALLAVGLLSLSTVSLRASSQGGSIAVAQANARLALMMALGDLQKYAGPDTRATARADILKDDNPPVTGVWRSWEGENHEQSGSTAGRPISVDYDQEKEDRFLGWLVSANDNQLPDTSSANGKVTLVGPGTVGEGKGRDELEVHLDPLEVKDEDGDLNGGVAWWVSGENQKARIPKPYEPEDDKGGQWASHMKSHAVADPEVFRMDKVLNDFSLADKAITLKEGDFIAKESSLEVSREFFHDLSATSVGLQTNMATGGWKKDLSLFSENSSINSGPNSTTRLPLFRLSPENEVAVNLASRGNVRGTKSAFYPWSEYRGSAADQPIYQHPAVASWNNLLDYTLLYKNVGSGVSISPTSYAWNDTANTYNFLHKVRILPVIARIQWVYSYFAATPDRRATPAPPKDSLQPCMVLTPVITMWNPYNLRITTQNLRFDIPRPIPTAFRFRAGGTSNAKFQAITADPKRSVNYPAPSISDGDVLRYRINQGFTLQPGETRVFGPTRREEDNDLILQPGYEPGQGHLYRLVNDAGDPIYGSRQSNISLEAAFDTTYTDGRDGVGIYLDMRVNNSSGPHLVYRMVYTPEVANAVYPVEDNIAASEALGDLTATPTPFLTTVFGARMASRTHIPAKGFLQSSPLVNYTAMGDKDESERTIAREYRGTDHPVNSPFDYSFRTVGVNDTNLPDVDGSSNRGFIVTGFQKSEGLSRCVVAEIPTRPLQSLGELQHWDLRYENPIPPFAFNLIGNSDATPLIGSDEVVGNFSDGVNLQHDDSYCANHVLFDDWFLSSIAPDPDDLGTNGRTLREVFTEFVEGTENLPNAAYRPITADSSGDANEAFSEYVNTSDAWQKIASRLEVEGMFNVNSTSQLAWRAILGHARNQKVPYLKEGSGRTVVELSDETDFATSRFSISGESDTSSNGSSGAFPGANEFTGYRNLDEEMIDALAEEIVEQVRLRGPFLSLAEFVNRQLTDGDLALAGAIQTALNEIARSQATNPYKGITSIISRPASKNPGNVESDYEFPEAAEGEGTYGLPGWTRQADVLRPLAPIMTARDDTFTIRAYGDARDKNNTITARAICEATVRRTRDYVDPTDEADIVTAPKSEQNKLFGRRFNIVSFRWLSSDEI